MTKLKIGFEVTNSWYREEFRQLIKIIMFNFPSFCKNQPPSEIEVFIISNNDSSAYVYKIGSLLGLNDGYHTQIVNFRQDKVDKCVELGINIFFDEDSLTTVLLEPTDTWAILVRSITDPYHVTMKYVTEFEDVLRTISEGQFPEPNEN